MCSYSDKWRQKKFAQGLCATCGKVAAVSGKNDCEICAEKIRTRQKERYYRDKKLGKERHTIRANRLKAANLCIRCGKAAPAIGKITCQACLDRHSELLLAMKIKVFEAYGGCHCNCCGEDTMEFLTLDHINNDGAKHRREVFKGRDAWCSRTLYKWIIDNEFPPIFQVLCANCNWGKRLTGVCPHKLKDRQRSVPTNAA